MYRHTKINCIERKLTPEKRVRDGNYTGFSTVQNQDFPDCRLSANVLNMSGMNETKEW